MDDRMYAERSESAGLGLEVADTRAPYEAPTLLTVEGALTTLLGSAAVCTVTEPPDQDFA